jgi:fluoroquinolone transport system ATP-binding protein
VRYPGARREAVAGISFSVEPGEIFGFLGPSGAGKSTTQKVLTGLIRRFGGSVELAGEDTRAAGRRRYERIGVGLEVPNLFGKLSARENLEVFARLYEGPTENPERLLAAVDLEQAGDERTERMSKGMRTRLNVVRAFLNRPEVVFLDEPTSGLDPGTAALVKNLIREKQREGTTVFLTTHDMGVADQLCDRVAFMVDGELPVTDSPRKLKIAHGSKRIAVEYLDDGRPAYREFSFENGIVEEDCIEFLRTRETETIHTLEATLEDVFLEVTGRVLSEEARL